MSKFKAGDRVSVYGFDSNGVRNYRAAHTVVRVDDDMLEVKFDGEDLASDKTTSVHENQCRRLKPKQKRGPRRVWITTQRLFQLDNTAEGAIEAFISNHRVISEDVEFIEVIKK